MAKTLFNAAMAVRHTDVPNIRQAVPFLGVKDIEASLRFYVDGLGFTITSRWDPEGRIRWCWLELDRVAMMLQEYWKDGRPGGWPAGVLGQGVCICLIVCGRNCRISQCEGPGPFSRPNPSSGMAYG